MGEQLELDLRVRSWGGARPGAGRPKGKTHVAMPHRTHERLKRWEPVHVTLRVGADVPCLRNSEIADLIESCLYRQRKRRPRDFQVVHDSIQDDHIHLIAEALDAATLGRGVAALKILIAKSMNRVAERRGRVFTDRYHRQDLTTPTQVRNALSYVLMNLHKHSRVYSDTAFADPRSSAPTFDGFTEAVAMGDSWLWPAVTPRTWLLAKGWRRHGLIPPWLPSHLPNTPPLECLGAASS